MDRTELNRHLAKAVAYVQCGKPELAEAHLGALVDMFADEGVSPRTGEVMARDAAVRREAASREAIAWQRRQPVQYDLSDFSRRLGSQLL
jgi:hypothetical protein